MDHKAFSRRIDRLRLAMAREQLDAFLIHDRNNTAYFSGFKGTSSIIVISESAALFFTDFRYIQQAGEEMRGFDVRLMTQGGATELAAALKQLKPHCIGFEGAINYTQYLQFKCAAARAKMVESGTMPATLRSVKEPWEIEIMAANQRLNERIFQWATRSLKPGMTERRLQKGIRIRMLDAGCEESFDTIAASGANSAHPHAHVTARRIRKADLLMIDMGVKRDGYNSDLTRTVAVECASPRARAIFDIVLEAQERALAAVRPGAVCRDVDAVARSFIASAGYGEFFGHGLGHGVGLDIHEYPRLNPRSTVVLEEGMTITIEPGIYIPGFGGVRIEDLVVVIGDGYRNLTKTGKRLRFVGR
ncbi:MAG: Xaa-Pro peptidase family protein [bacterium]